MTPEELAHAVERDEVDTVVVAFTDHLGRLMGKRFDAGFFLEEAVGHGTHGCNYLLTVDMEMEPIEGFSYTNWERGYGDFHLVPDLDTMRVAGWAEQTAIVLCDVCEGADDRAVTVAPRTVLRTQLDRAAAMDLTVNAASELEFFVFEESYRDGHEAGYANLTPSGWYNEDYHLLQGARVEPFVGAARKALRQSGIPVENSKGEAARGQHELNIRYADALTMADRHALMKHGMKELADSHGRSITFMAKPVEAESGNSCHIHLSVTGPDGANVFEVDGELSDRFRWFLGGWMSHLGDLMVFYAPTVNSYKRYVEASWAPTRIAWSLDNRTAGFRVVGSGAGRRIECRIPGGDVNPYLVYAAAVASGLDGIANQIEPPERYDGDVYSSTEPERVPGSLAEAVRRFDESAFARSTFGDEVVDHYVHFFRAEVSAYDRAVTDWELRRYFERI